MTGLLEAAPGPMDQLVQALQGIQAPAAAPVFRAPIFNKDSPDLQQRQSRPSTKTAPIFNGDVENLWSSSEMWQRGTSCRREELYSNSEVAWKDQPEPMVGVSQWKQSYSNYRPGMAHNAKERLLNIKKEIHTDLSSDFAAEVSRLAGIAHPLSTCGRK